MSLEYHPRTQRIVCRWKEPVRVVMNKAEGVMDKVRTLHFRLGDNGKLKARDRKRHQSHPMFQHVTRFSDELRRTGAYTSEASPKPCRHCGSTEGVIPCYDMKLKRIVWLCEDPIRCGR